MKITLSDHTGESVTGDTVDHKQWIVFCDDVHVGYLAKSPGAWLQCIVFMDDATKKELIEAVSHTAMQPVGGAAVPVDPELMPQDEGEDE